jgi:hypothetical protein
VLTIRTWRVKLLAVISVPRKTGIVAIDAFNESVNVDGVLIQSVDITVFEYSASVLVVSVLIHSLAVITLASTESEKVDGVLIHSLAVMTFPFTESENVEGVLIHLAEITVLTTRSGSTNGCHDDAPFPSDFKTKSSGGVVVTIDDVT